MFVTNEYEDYKTEYKAKSKIRRFYFLQNEYSKPYQYLIITKIVTDGNIINLNSTQNIKKPCLYPGLESQERNYCSCALRRKRQCNKKQSKKGGIVLHRINTVH